MKPGTALFLRGALAVVVGVVAVAWPGITVGAFVILFAVYAFLAGGMEAARAFGSRDAGPVAGHLLLGVLDIAAGVVALAWPGITALVLVVWVAVWALLTGVVEVALAFRADETAGQRALFVLGGLVSVALGVVLFVRPDIGALALAQVYGLFSLVSGFTLAATGWAMRETAGQLRADHSAESVRQR